MSGPQRKQSNQRFSFKKIKNKKEKQQSFTQKKREKSTILACVVVKHLEEACS